MDNILIYTIGQTVFVQAAFVMKNMEMRIYKANKQILTKNISHTDLEKTETNLPNGKYNVKLIQRTSNKTGINEIVEKKILINKKQNHEKDY